MSPERLLLLSNSTMAGEKYLGWPETAIRDFLGRSVKRAFFVPYAGVRVDWDEYARMVRERFTDMGYEMAAAHETEVPKLAAADADAIVVGGGNTFCLLDELYRTGLLYVIRARVKEGVPYVGWSAGSNVAGPTVKTTNDMPIVEPPSLRALGVIPFQINPHFTDAQPPGHAGETRTDRILEFLKINPEATVLGLPEGTALRREGSSLRLLGSKPARLFLNNEEPRDAPPEEPLDFLLARQ